MQLTPLFSSHVSIRLQLHGDTRPGPAADIRNFRIDAQEILGTATI